MVSPPCFYIWLFQALALLTGDHPIAGAEAGQHRLLPGQPGQPGHSAVVAYTQPSMLI